MWWWKDSIDRTFMRKYSDDLPAMSAAAGSLVLPQLGQPLPAALAAMGVEGLTLLAESRMRCGGCGAKVGC